MAGGPAVDASDDAQLAMVDRRILLAGIRVAHTDETGDHGNSDADPGQAANDIRLEQCGVQDIRPQALQHASQLTDTSRNRGRLQHLHLDARPLSLGPETWLAVVKADHRCVDPNARESGYELEQRALRAAGPEAANHVEDAHAVGG